MDYKALTVSQVEQSQSTSVWAMNTSASKGTGKGIINLTITEGNGRSTVVRIPVTFIPVDLTTQATKSALTMSPDFRRLVASRIITLISDADAEKMLDNDKARAEQSRLLNIESLHEVDEQQQTAEVRSMMAEASGNIGGLALNIAHTTDGDEEAVVANLRNNAEALTKDELKYIVDNSQMHKVKVLAADLLVD